MTLKPRSRVTLDFADIAEVWSKIAPRFPLRHGKGCPDCFKSEASKSFVRCWALLDIENTQIEFSICLIFNVRSGKWVVWSFSLERSSGTGGLFHPYSPQAALKCYGAQPANVVFQTVGEAMAARSLDLDLWRISRQVDLVTLLKVYDEAANIMALQSPLFVYLPLVKSGNH